jgi:hypothetical protein
VYDKTQATKLKDFLEGLDVGLTVYLSHVDLGIAKRNIRSNGRPSTGTAMTSTQRSRKSREKKKMKAALERFERANLLKQVPLS